VIMSRDSPGSWHVSDLSDKSWDSLDGRLWKTMVGTRSDAGFPIAEGLDNSQYGSILMEGILMRWYCAETIVILCSDVICESYGCLYL